MQRCNRCEIEKPLTEEFFYVLKARKKHPTDGWQSHCKECWQEINRENKKNIKARKKALSVESGLENTLDPTSVPSNQPISVPIVVIPIAPNIKTNIIVDDDDEDDVVGSMFYARASSQ
jgi:hypothetical protein